MKNRDKSNAVELSTALQPTAADNKLHSSWTPFVLFFIANNFEGWFSPQEVCDKWGNGTEEEITEICKRFLPYFFQGYTEQNGKIWKFKKKYAFIK